jgi:hypothetical protein
MSLYDTDHALVHPGVLHQLPQQLGLCSMVWVSYGLCVAALVDFYSPDDTVDTIALSHCRR